MLPRCRQSDLVLRKLGHAPSASDLNGEPSGRAPRTPSFVVLQAYASEIGRAAHQWSTLAIVPRAPNDAGAPHDVARGPGSRRHPNFETAVPLPGPVHDRREIGRDIRRAVDDRRRGGNTVVVNFDVRVDRAEYGVVPRVGTDTDVVDPGPIETTINEGPAIDVASVDEETHKAVLPLESHVIGRALVPRKRSDGGTFRDAELEPPPGRVLRHGRDDAGENLVPIGIRRHIDVYLVLGVDDELHIGCRVGHRSGAAIRTGIEVELDAVVGPVHSWAVLEADVVIVETDEDIEKIVVVSSMDSSGVVGPAYWKPEPRGATRPVECSVVEPDESDLARDGVTGAHYGLEPRELPIVDVPVDIERACPRDLEGGGRDVRGGCELPHGTRGRAGAVLAVDPPEVRGVRFEISRLKGILRAAYRERRWAGRSEVNIVVARSGSSRPA